MAGLGGGNIAMQAKSYSAQKDPFYGMSQAQSWASLQDALGKATKDKKYAKELTNQAMGMFTQAYNQNQSDIGQLRSYVGGQLLPVEKQMMDESQGTIRAQAKNSKNAFVKSVGSRLGRTSALTQAYSGKSADMYTPGLIQDYLKNVSVQQGLQRLSLAQSIPSLSGAAAQLPLGLSSFVSPWLGSSNSLQLGSIQGLQNMAGLSTSSYSANKSGGSMK